MVKIKSAWIERVEGKIEECIKINCTSFEKLNYAVKLMSLSAPEKGNGYDKTDFFIEFEDGETYKGGIDLQKEYATNGYSVQKHIIYVLEYYAKNGLATVDETIDFVEKYIGLEHV
jgi:hypothetical protein